jgi:hypothetical protein
MQESHEVRPSQSPRPRVMRRDGQLSRRSVHRGTAGPCIDLPQEWWARRRESIMLSKGEARAQTEVHARVQGIGG